jgi:hypothetical protein
MSVETSKNLAKLAGWFRLTDSLKPEAREHCAEVCSMAARELDRYRTSLQAFSYKDCEMPEYEDGVHLWFVQGIKGKWYPTKIVAEQAARITFPDDKDAGYGRIYYCTFIGEA